LNSILVSSFEGKKAKRFSFFPFLLFRFWPISPRTTQLFFSPWPSLSFQLRSPPVAQKPTRFAFPLLVPLPGGARWSSPTSGQTPSRAGCARCISRTRAPSLPLGLARQGRPAL
jgi:hypothetical protein